MIECGEIYYIKGSKKGSIGSEIWSGRPAVIISSEEAIRNQGTVNIVYLTSSDGEKELTVAISDDDFEYKKNQYECHTVLCAQVHSVDKSRIGNYYGRVTPEELKLIETTVKERTLF